jgi:hypothetical protein
MDDAKADAGEDRETGGGIATMGNKLVVVLIDMFPLLLLVAVWAFFIIRVRRAATRTQSPAKPAEIAATDVPDKRPNRAWIIWLVPAWFLFGIIFISIEAFIRPVGWDPSQQVGMLFELPFAFVLGLWVWLWWRRPEAAKEAWTRYQQYRAGSLPRPRALLYWIVAALVLVALFNLPQIFAGKK